MDDKITTEFVGFPKIARLSRGVVITEKIDGTNASIYIGENGEFKTGSRTRWITPEDDNHGFSRWAHDNKDELMTMGKGRHFGEWWGQGIQRNYGLKEKRFSLFNTIRWCPYGGIPSVINTTDPRIVKYQDVLPKCVGLVPVLWSGIFDTSDVDIQIGILKTRGSVAAPGFMNPEGIVVYHIAGNVAFKKTLEKDNEFKGGIK